MAEEGKAASDGCCACRMNGRAFSRSPTSCRLPRLRNGDATQAAVLAWVVKFHTVSPQPGVIAERNLKRMTCDGSHLGNVARRVETSIKITYNSPRNNRSVEPRSHCVK